MPSLQRAFVTIKQCSLHFLYLIILLLTSGSFALSDITFTEKLFNLVKTRYNQDAEVRVRDWQQLLLQQKNQPVNDQLYEINRFFNAMDFVDDKQHWGKNDYWATPIEFLATNAGDCEDFTIAKYFSLIEVGIPSEKLRLMYVTATRPRQAHMVLAYYATPTSVPLVLDNINKRILPATQRRDLIPIYSFNGDGLWQAKSQGQGRQLQSKNNNSLWQDLTERMKQGYQ
jgi:predicted transglutaminase-like cysteine proteinase